MYLALLSALTAPSAADQWDIGGELGLELRAFPEGPAYPAQEDATVSPSIALQPEFRYEGTERINSITFRPFVRWDAYDDERSHFDIRELNFIHLAPKWDVLVGASRVFWGVTESVHLVDIINQTDAVEDIDSEDKLGQPMVNLNLIRDSGTYSFFVLPGFRQRTLPGDDARRRGPFPIDTDNATYESGAEDWHVDYALRWSRAIGDWDVGASYFYGTSREPRLFPFVETSGAISLRPHYDLIHQLGLDVQFTKGAWLWKLETIARVGHGDAFLASVAGFEFTFFQIRESNVDLGLLAEFQYDGRDDNIDAPFIASDNDLFMGARVALNDESSTSALAGLVVDVTNASTAGLIEAERRLSEHWKAELEARLFIYADRDDPFFSFRRDDSITLRMRYSF